MKQAWTLVAALIMSAAAIHAASDWPQWQGPDRSGISKETGLLKAWPSSGPPLVWTATGLGGGYSTPSVAAGRLYVMGSKGGEEFAHALDVRSGEKSWSVKVGNSPSAIEYRKRSQRATSTSTGSIITR